MAFYHSKDVLSFCLHLYVVFDVFQSHECLLFSNRHGGIINLSINPAVVYIFIHLLTMNNCMRNKIIWLSNSLCTFHICFMCVDS